MQFFKDILGLFYTDVCASCYKNLLKSETILCAICLHDLPVIRLNDYENNEIKTIFYGRVPVHKIASFLYFRKEGIAKKLIHKLKYKGHQEIGVFLGNYLGKQLQQKKVFTNVDYIIPVPLHPKKHKKRGYNQVTSFGKTLSNVLEISYKPNVLRRVSTIKTQTLKQRFERFSNTKTKFLLTNTKIFENKHILLIDDVITTGATLEACCNELLKTKNITISIVTMAYTERI